MRRSHRILVLALATALVAMFAVPMVASAGSSGSGSDFSGDEFSETDEFSESTTEDVGFEETDDASTDEYPREGIASGGGSTAAGGPSPLPLLVSAGVFALLAVGAGGLALRRRLGR